MCRNRRRAVAAARRGGRGKAGQCCKVGRWSRVVTQRIKLAGAQFGGRSCRRGRSGLRVARPKCWSCPRRVPASARSVAATGALRAICQSVGRSSVARGASGKLRSNLCSNGSRTATRAAMAFWMARRGRWQTGHPGRRPECRPGIVRQPALWRRLLVRNASPHEGRESHAVRAAVRGVNGTRPRPSDHANAAVPSRCSSSSTHPFSRGRRRCSPQRRHQRTACSPSAVGGGNLSVAVSPRMRVRLCPLVAFKSAGRRYLRPCVAAACHATASPPGCSTPVMVISGAIAPSAASRAVFGAHPSVRRCRMPVCLWVRIEIEARAWWSVNVVAVTGVHRDESSSGASQ